MKKSLMALAVLLLVGVGAKVLLWPADDIGPPATPNSLSQAQLVARGAYLARAGEIGRAHV